MFTLNPLRMKLPVKLVLIITAVIFFGDYLSLHVKEACYAISLTIKTVLRFALPFVIFSYLSSCLLSFKKGVIAFIIILLGTVYVSNFIATQIGFGAGVFVSQYIHPTQSLSSNEIMKILVPTWEFDIDPILSNEMALALGLLGGLTFCILRNFAHSRNNKALLKISAGFEHFTEVLKKISTFFLMRLFIPVVPLFILGYVIKLQYEGALGQILSSYLPVFVFTGIVQFTYIILLFGIANMFHFNRWYIQVKNTIPSVITGLSTMSSAAAMPLTIQAAEQNTNNPTMARIIVPSTVNIHMIGNLIGNPILAAVLMASFGVTFPDLQTFIICGLGLALAQFAVAGVAGGGILVLLPLFEKYMGFNGEMISIITAVYMFFDIIISGSNVMGCGWLTVILNKIFTKLKIGSE